MVRLNNHNALRLLAMGFEHVVYRRQEIPIFKNALVMPGIAAKKLQSTIF